MKHVSRRPTYKDRVEYFGRLSTDDHRAPKTICQDKERDEEVALIIRNKTKSGCEPKFDQVDGRVIDPLYTLQGLIVPTWHTLRAMWTVANIVGRSLFWGSVVLIRNPQRPLAPEGRDSQGWFSFISRDMIPALIRLNRGWRQSYSDRSNWGWRSTTSWRNTSNYWMVFQTTWKGSEAS